MMSFCNLFMERPSYLPKCCFVLISLLILLIGKSFIKESLPLIGKSSFIQLLGSCLHVLFSLFRQGWCSWHQRLIKQSSICNSISLYKNPYQLWWTQSVCSHCNGIFGSKLLQIFYCLRRAVICWSQGWHENVNDIYISMIYITIVSWYFQAKYHDIFDIFDIFKISTLLLLLITYFSNSCISNTNCPSPEAIRCCKNIDEN